MHRFFALVLTGCGVSADVPCAPQLDLGDDATISLTAAAAVLGIKACGVDGIVGCGLDSTRRHDPEPVLHASFDDDTDPRFLVLALERGDLSETDLDTVGFWCSGELYEPEPADTATGWMSDVVVVVLEP